MKSAEAMNTGLFRRDFKAEFGQPFREYPVKLLRLHTILKGTDKKKEKKGTDLLLEPFNLSKKPKTRDTSRFYEIKPFILTLSNIDNLLRAIPERHYDLIMLFNGPAVTLLQTEECAPYREEIWQLQQTWVSFKVCKSQPAVYRGHCATSARGHRPVCAYSYEKQTALHGWERPPRRRSY